MRLNSSWSCNQQITYENLLPIHGGRFNLEMYPPPGRTWVDPAWSRRQHSFHLCPGGKCGRIPHRPFGTPTRMVGLLRLDGHGGRNSGGLCDLPAGRKGRPGDPGKESGKAARGKTLPAFRKTRGHHGVRRLDSAAAVPFHIRPDGRRGHAASAQEVLVSADSGTRPAFLQRGVSEQGLWPADDRLFLAALSDDAICADRAGSGGRHRRRGLFQMVSTRGKKGKAPAPCNTSRTGKTAPCVRLITSMSSGKTRRARLPAILLDFRLATVLHTSRIHTLRGGTSMAIRAIRGRD